jgi:hypothetical protein
LERLNSLLLSFASQEKFTPYRKVPRAKGKSFFLGLRRDDSILFIAEETTPTAPVTIDGVNVNRSAQEFDTVEDRLLHMLRERWPDLKVAFASKAAH